MRSGKNYLILLLAIATFTTSAIAWRQYRELIVLRAAALDQDERAALQKRVWDAEKRRSELEKELAARPTKTESADDADEPPTILPFPPPANGARPAGPRNFGRAMDRPEMQKLFALQRKSALDGRYATLFKSLNLSPDQLEKFKNLLVDKTTAVSDVAIAAREQGINPRTDRDAYRKLLADAQNGIESEIHDLLGDAGFSQYQHYEHTQPQRNVVTQLEQRLSYTSTPLTPAQSAQLVDILAATNTSTQSNPGFRGRAAVNNFYGVNTSQAAISETAINQALGLLAGPQVDALRQLQQEQQAQAELAAAMRREFQAARPNPPASNPAPKGSQ